MNTDSLANSYLNTSGFNQEIAKLGSLGTKSFASSLKTFQASLVQMSSLSSNFVITSELQEALGSLVSTANSLISESVISASKSFIEELASSSPDLSDDYVTFNKPEIIELTLPDSIAIPLGNKRIRMSTSIFIAIISTILLPILFHLSDSIVNLHQSVIEAENEQKRLELEQERNDLLYEGNQLYKQWLDAFQSLDSSHSSQSESIELLKESLPPIDSHLEVPGSDHR